MELHLSWAISILDGNELERLQLSSQWLTFYLSAAGVLEQRKLQVALQDQSSAV